MSIFGAIAGAPVAAALGKNVAEYFNNTSAHASATQNTPVNVNNQFQNAMDNLLHSFSDQHATDIEQLQLNREYNSREAELARQFSAEEALKSREWQKMMSDTSYQRAVQDLQKAGLNPILALQNGGASTPSGSTASSSSASMSSTGGIKASDYLDVLKTFITSASQFNNNVTNSIFGLFSTLLPLL